MDVKIRITKMGVRKGEVYIKEACLLVNGKIDRPVALNEQLAVFLKQTDIDLNTEEFDDDSGTVIEQKDIFLTNKP